jgi:predicted DNA-binding ribbon-helix-helix protein
VISLSDIGVDHPGTASRAHARQPHSERESVRSSLVRHNVYVAGHRTSIRIEPVIWRALHDIARQQKVTLHDLVSDIDRTRPGSGGLSSAIRAYVVAYLAAGLREALSAPSHTRAWNFKPGFASFE